MRTPRRRRLLPLASALVLAGAITLTGCSGTVLSGPSGDDAAIDSAAIASSIKAEVPRVSEVAEVDGSVDGAGGTLYLELRTSSAEPFSAEELRGVLVAVWQTANNHPTDVDITAQDAGRGRTGVDLTAAAAQVLGDDFAEYGKGGITTTGLTRLLGPWPAR